MAVSRVGWRQGLGKRGREQVGRQLAERPFADHAISIDPVMHRQCQRPVRVGDRSVAIDDAWLPYGLPLWIDSTTPDVPELGRAEAPLRRLVVAQDTGGAITGPVRADLFLVWDVWDGLMIEGRLFGQTLFARSRRILQTESEVLFNGGAGAGLRYVYPLGPVAIDLGIRTLIPFRSQRFLVDEAVVVQFPRFQIEGALGVSVVF